MVDNPGTTSQRDEKNSKSDFDDPRTSSGLTSLPPVTSYYERIALGVILLGVMMTGIDTTAVVLALPSMMTELNTGLSSMIWVIMAYLVVITIFGTQVGRLGDMYGRVRTYNMGFAIFTVGSLLCGLSQSSWYLIMFRILQGIGGAMVFSNSGAIIADTVNEESRGRAYGIIGIGYSIGAILGILLGGLIITFVSWRYIFFINIPLGIVAVVVCYKVLRDRQNKVKRKLDLVGMGTFGVGLLLILLALTDAAGAGLSATTIALLGLGGGTIVGFAFWERHHPDALLDLSLFRRRILTASISASFFQALASFAVLFLVIMYLQGVRDLSPLNSSLLLVPGYVLGAVVAPFAGKASDKWGAHYIASGGLALQGLGIFIYATLTIASPLWTVVLGAIINGVGSSTFFPPNNSAVMANSPKESYGIASGLLRTSANIGMVCSFAIALLIASLAIPRDLAISIFLGTSKLGGDLSAAFVNGMHAALGVSIAVIAVGIILSVFRGKETRGIHKNLTG
jgi:EmrB/QacA subfamily drug resistance transporter